VHAAWACPGTSIVNPNPNVAPASNRPREIALFIMVFPIHYARQNDALT
jgi:hypothetical protein